MRTLIALAVFATCVVGSAVAQTTAPASWPAITLAEPREVKLAGPLGDDLDRGVARLSKAPYTAPWLLADVSFEVKRIFTNYSGDVSGRFLELASLTRGKDDLPTLSPVMAGVPRCQKADGHFGAEVDLSKPLPKNCAAHPHALGQCPAARGAHHGRQALRRPRPARGPRKLGDFYVASAEQLCSPKRLADYLASGSYGDGYTCCYFPAIESLAMLHRATGDARYLEMARRMAEFFVGHFDALPIDHSHGNLCAWRASCSSMTSPANANTLTAPSTNGRRPSPAATSGRSAGWASTGMSTSAPPRRAASPTGCDSTSTCGDSPARRSISTWPSACCTTSIA